MTNMAGVQSTSVPLKRKQHGDRMPPKLCEYTDEETGEVLRIETTKQAKRRHQKSGGAQWRPTKGQINAADIWNKQEEKIKRDKEREERKKRNAVRQSEKDAEQRRKQEELLRKGKISVEDTWAKVSASQVRLNKFFCPPQPRPECFPESAPDMSRSDDTGSQTMVNRKPEESIHEVDCSIEKKNLLYESPIRLDEDLGDYFTNSPLTQKSPPSITVGKAALMETEPIAESQRLMPPPPPRRSRSQQHTVMTKQSLPAVSSLSSPNRIVLAELSPAQLNSLAAKHQSPEILRTKAGAQQFHNKSPFLSTQVVSETLAGLSSQDFEDDFQMDKENVSPYSWRSCEEKPKELYNTISPTITSKSCPAAVTYGDFNENSNSSHDEFDDDDFDDDDIDDETLISIAATQKLKKDFLMAAKSNATSRISEQKPTLSTVSTHQNPIITSTTGNPISKTSDSFTFTDIDDDELIRVVEDFENDTDDLSDEDLLQCMESFEGKQEPAQKKRRIKPWDVFPIDMET